MARQENPPFARGATFYNGGTIDSNNLGGLQWEGKEWEFEDLNYAPTTVGALPARSNQLVRCRIVRNVSGIALLGKRLANLQLAPAAGSVYGSRIDGYCDFDGARAYPIDEFLPAAGVPNNDLCWIVVDGPATVLTGLANSQGNSIAIGDFIVALTAVTSQSVTAGYCQDISLPLANLTNALTQLQANGVAPDLWMNVIGRAMSAATTNQTGIAMLVAVGKW